MAGAAVQAWPPRIVAGALITDAGAVAVSLGGVRSAVRNGAGDYTITFRDFTAGPAPGRAPLMFATPVSDTTFRALTVTAPTALTMRVLAFDAAGNALDTAFFLLVVSSERTGGIG